MAIKINNNSDNSGINFSKSKEVVKGLLALFKIPSIPAPPVSKRTAVSAVLRSGLSASDMASEIISRQKDAGALIGPNDDGSENIAEAMEVVRCQVIIEHIMKNCRVTVTSLPGQQITASGVTPPGGGPVTTVGTVLSTGTAYGVLS